MGLKGITTDWLEVEQLLNPNKIKASPMK